MSRPRVFSDEERRRRKVTQAAVHYRANKQAYILRAKKWGMENLEEHRTRMRAYMRKRMGLPEPTRPCPEICERPGCTRKAVCLDHDHKTGKFRGWLCRPDNMALGALGDGIAGVEGIRDYLLRP